MPDEPPAPLSVLTGDPGPWKRSAVANSPDVLWLARTASVLESTPARMARHLAALARVPSHPARPRVFRPLGNFVVLEPLSGATHDATTAIEGWKPKALRRLDGTIREALAWYLPERNASRALSAHGINRSRIDAFLDAGIAIATPCGATLGGVHPTALFDSLDGRVVCIDWCHAQSDGPWCLDLAAAERVLPSPTLDAFDLELARLALALGRPPDRAATVSAVLDRLFPRRDPSTVAVQILGPDWLDRSHWLPHGPVCSAAEARRIAHAIDGVTVAGVPIRVRSTPLIRHTRGERAIESVEARHRRLFSRWNDGIQVDREGIVSATPEALAAWFCRDLTGHVMDGTAGVGSLTIALALRDEVTHVTAVDNDRTRLRMAEHNAALYGVASKIEFVHDDVLAALHRVRADALVLDPPWGKGYDKLRVTLADLPMDVRPVLAVAPDRVSVKLPRSFAPETLPGAWRFDAAVDSRGSIKFLRAARQAR